MRTGCSIVPGGDEDEHVGEPARVLDQPGDPPCPPAHVDGSADRHFEQRRGVVRDRHLGGTRGEADEDDRDDDNDRTKKKDKKGGTRHWLYAIDKKNNKNKKNDKGNTALAAFRIDNPEEVQQVWELGPQCCTVHQWRWLLQWKWKSWNLFWKSWNLYW